MIRTLAFALLCITICEFALTVSAEDIIQKVCNGVKVGEKRVRKLPLKDIRCPSCQQGGPPAGGEMAYTAVNCDDEKQRQIEKCSLLSLQADNRGNRADVTFPFEKVRDKDSNVDPQVSSEFPMAQKKCKLKCFRKWDVILSCEERA